MAIDDMKTPLVALLKKYQEDVGVSMRSAIRDLLTELHHLSDTYKLPFCLIEDDAEEVYKAETMDEDTQE